MRRRYGILAAIVALLFYANGGWSDDDQGTPMVHGTSNTQSITQLANPNTNGLRVGAFYDASVNKRGLWIQPVVLQTWDMPVAVSSNALVNDFKWYMNDNHTTTMVNFTSTTLNNARTIAIWPNFTNDTSYSTETCNTSMTLTGTGYWGETITETIDIHVTSPTYRIESQKAFKTITAISWVDPDAAAAAAGLDEYTSNNITFDIGPGKYLGLKYAMHSDLRLKELVDSTGGTGGLDADSAGTFVKGDPTWAATSKDWRGLWSPNTAMDGQNDYGILYVTTDIIQRWPTDRVDPYYGRASP